jgi:dTDP-4-dehydrorhamnose reductase
LKKAFQVNAIGALNVAKASNEIDAVNVYISTDYVFDGAKGVPYTEEDIPNPINVYGLSKYTGEVFTRNYSGKYYIIRVASLYGKAGARGKGGNFVVSMIQRAKNEAEIKVVDDVFMSPTYTKDVSRMLKSFLDLDLAIKPAFGVYHMVNEGYCNWYEFTKEIFSILGWDAKIQITPIRSNELKRLATRPIFSALRNKKLDNLGFGMRNWECRAKCIISSW